MPQIPDYISGSKNRLNRLVKKGVIAFGNKEFTSTVNSIPSLRSTGVVPAESYATVWE